MPPKAKTLTIKADDLQAIVEGLEAIASAATGMFSLVEARLVLETDGHKLVATYGQGWEVEIEVP